ncbi:MAG TPA: DUF4911 domain-containing protein [Syntrophales bacterium]|nr:DUF4911 domain-containing protein [Syntrophales bacterium]HOL58518.1 DUF4911 domain-containing protein [Syntrophales bacterium]HPO34874.1 DUF4911 domain-containing protein [Syntrophales bacterium]
MKSRLKLPRAELARFQFILESYEGIFYVSTEDARAAIVSVFVPPGLREEGKEVLTALREEIPYEDLNFQGAEG